jgi:uncharacterized membrane protein YqhA
MDSVIFRQALDFLILFSFGVYNLYVAYKIARSEKNVVLLHERFVLELYADDSKKREGILERINSQQSIKQRLYASIVFGLLLIFWAIARVLPT